MRAPFRAQLSLPIVLAALALTLSTLMLAACHTTAGIGQDVSAAGHAVTHGAESVEKHL
jgi:predicted small secreted protein